MADWVHCNSCFHQPGDGHKFLLTNCGHIYCDDCVGPGTSEKCKMCSNSNVTTLALSGKMKPDVEIFFTDPMEILKKQLKQTQQVIQVMDFQKNHRQRLTSYNKERLTKQSQLMSRAQRAMEQVKDIEREVMVLKQENSYLTKLLQSKGGGVSRHPGQWTPHQGSSKSPIASQSNMASMVRSMTYGKDGQYSHSVMSPGNAPIGPARLSVRTPPSHGRLGIVPTPSPTKLAVTPGRHDAVTPGRYDSATMRGSPMNVSPSGRSHCLPPTCMPMTPNRPATPHYLTASATQHREKSPAHASQLSQPEGYPRTSQQTNYWPGKTGQLL